MYVDPGINTSASNLKWVLPYCKPDLPRVVGALLLFIANNTMALTIPILSGIIVDRVIVGGHVDELPRLCGLMILMTIIRVGARYGYQMWMERFGQNSVYRLVSDEYEKLHELDFTYFNHTRTGDIMSRLTSDTDAIRHCLSWVSYQIADCVVMFVGALCVMFAIDWRLALVLACVTPFIFVLTRGLSTHAHPLFFAIRNSLASLNSMVEENIEGNRVVKAFVREPYETEKFDEHNDDYMQCNMALAYNSRKYMPWLDGLGFSLQLITLGLGGFLVIKGYMTLGNLVSFNSFLWMIDGPVRQSGWLINDWQRFNASCIKIRKLLTEQPRIVEKPDAVEAVKQAVTIVEQVKHDDEATGATGAPVASGTSGAQQSTERKSCPLHIKGDIRFDHVSFAFPDDPETPILKDLDFTVPAGSKLGILGETGAGKSTLVSLISRFYDPTVGHVLIDGIDARDWPLATLRSQVCIVAQDTFLFSDTIGGNIGFGASGDSDDRYIQKMAQIAGADNFIRSMPQGNSSRRAIRERKTSPRSHEKCEVPSTPGPPSSQELLVHACEAEPTRKPCASSPKSTEHSTITVAPRCGCSSVPAVSAAIALAAPSSRKASGTITHAASLGAAGVTCVRLAICRAARSKPVVAMQKVVPLSSSMSANINVAGNRPQRFASTS